MFRAGILKRTHIYILYIYTIIIVYVTLHTYIYNIILLY